MSSTNLIQLIKKEYEKKRELLSDTNEIEKLKQEEKKTCLDLINHIFDKYPLDFLWGFLECIAQFMEDLKENEQEE